MLHAQRTIISKLWKLYWLLSHKQYLILSLLILIDIMIMTSLINIISLRQKSLVSNDAIIYNKRWSSIQPEMLRRLMYISTEGHSVTDFDTQYAFYRVLQTCN
jgi:hypothetical protein